MLKAVSKIFNPKKLGDSIIEGVDKTFLTKEESINYFKRFLVLYEPYKLAQRILAIMYSFAFLFNHLIIGVTHLIFVCLEKDASNVIKLYDYNNETLGTPILIIIGFYFAGGALEGVVKRFKK